MACTCQCGHAVLAEMCNNDASLMLCRFPPRVYRTKLHDS
jgi:hypothetical protein